jgi:hypothetical protein
MLARFGQAALSRQSGFKEACEARAQDRIPALAEIRMSFERVEHCNVASIMISIERRRRRGRERQNLLDLCA